jgi:hypothetical protein
MANQGNNAKAPASTCVWCESDYVPASSRARTASLFCCTKCEVEARFWLVARLESAVNGA